MGSSSGSKSGKKIEFFNAYLSIKGIQELINKYEIISFEAYLISTNSIPKFIKIINSSKVLENLKNENKLMESETVLKDSLKNYGLEKNIKILYENNDINNIIKNDNEKENEFIIVDELFCRVMQIDKYYEEIKKAYININNKEFNNELKFDSNDDAIRFIQKENKFYKFVQNQN